jgi:hypothetical protein
MVWALCAKIGASFVADWCGLVAKDATKNLGFGHFSKKHKKNMLTILKTFFHF